MENTNTAANQMIVSMRSMERRFDRVCRQIVLMNNNIGALEARYKRALKDERKKSLRYIMHHRILTLEGVRNMFWQYAQERADLLDEMERELKEKYDVEWDDVFDLDLSVDQEE